MSEGPPITVEELVKSDIFVWVTATCVVVIGGALLKTFGRKYLWPIWVLLDVNGDPGCSLMVFVFWLFIAPCYCLRETFNQNHGFAACWAGVIVLFGFLLRKRLMANVRALRRGRLALGAAPAGGFGRSGSRIAPSAAPEIRTFDEEVQAGVNLDDVEFPEYWTNTRSTNYKSDGTKFGFDQMVYVNAGSHTLFDELLNKTYKSISTQDRPCPKAADKCNKVPGGCPCVRPGGTPGLPTGFVVRRIIRVEDSGMWKRYCEKRNAIRAKRSGGADVTVISPPALTDEVADGHSDTLAPLDEKLNEVYLWHGTGIRVALSIAQHDFNINLAGSNAGTMYGRGAYMTESSTKADEYAFDEPGEYYDGIFAMLLVRACLGKYHYTTSREPEAGDKVKAGECDSVLGDRAASVNTFREFVVYDADQVYPEFVVLYQRIHQADDEAALRAGAHLPFHMELPVYWSNCHKNPHQEAFAHQYKVRQKTKALLQRFVSDTATKHTGVTVTEAFRVEVSEMWNRYTDFKTGIEARDIPTRILNGRKSGGQSGASLTIQRPGVSSFNKSSDEYADFCSSNPFSNKVETIALSCHWKDQDWGNKKGRLRVKLMRDGKGVVVQDLFGVCRSNDKKDWKFARRELSAKDPVVAEAGTGDVLQVEYLVGGGGGHSLHIRDFKCTIVLASSKEENESEAGDVDLEKGPEAKVKIARCMQPNELDGMEESGHALTSLLLEELDTEDCISAENLDSTINEMFLWHGTSREAAEAIIASGFRIPRGERAAHGKRFGEGAYFAEDLSKSLTYTTPEDGVHYVLLCRTLCGELFYTEERNKVSAHVDAKREGKDSVLANPEGNGPREFIVLEESQVYPEFIVKMKLP